VEYHPNHSIKHPYWHHDGLKIDYGDDGHDGDNDSKTNHQHHDNRNDSSDESHNKEIYINDKLYLMKPTMSLRNSNNSSSNSRSNNKRYSNVSRIGNIGSRSSLIKSKKMSGIDDVHIDDGNVIKESDHIKVDDSDDHHQLETPKQNHRKLLNVRSNNKSSKINKRNIKDNDMNNHDVDYNDINYNVKRDNNSNDNVEDHSDHDDNDDVIAYHLYQFPTLHELSIASETDLRSLGMGYRAKFIIDSMKIIKQNNNYELHRIYGSLNEKINSYGGDDNNDDAGVDDSILSRRWFHHLRSYSTLYNNNKEDIEKNIASDKLCRHEMESSYKKSRLIKRVDEKNEM